MTLQELGQKIKNQREEQNVSLEEVAQRIKLSVTILRAIEEGDTSLLPHAVYAKGFTRSYALSVGFTPDMVKEFLDDAFSAEIAEDATPDVSLTPNYKKQNTSKKFAFFACILLLILLIVGGTLFLTTSYWDDISSAVKKPFASLLDSPEATVQGQPEAVTAPDLQGGQTSEETVVSVSPDGESGATSGIENQTPATQPSVLSTAPSNSEASANTQTSGQGGTASTSTFTLVSPATVGKNEVEVVALEECYIRVQRENFSPIHQTLNANEQYKVRFNQRLNLVVGNAGGVSISYNGKDMGTIGETNQRKEIVFPLP